MFNVKYETRLVLLINTHMKKIFNSIILQTFDSEHSLVSRDAATSISTMSFVWINLYGYEFC